MKAYKKSKLTYENGYLVKGNDIIAVDGEIVRQLNKLDRDYQEAKFNEMRKIATAANASVIGAEFVPESERTTLKYEVETPNLDKAVEQTIKVMDEIDTCNNVRMAEEYLASIHEAVQFVDSGKVIGIKGCVPVQFDLPTIGNPLELDVDKLMDIVNEIFA